MITNLKKGFTGFDLKYMALIFMVLDHIHYFFEFTGRVPIIFTWIGRLAAPLFLFCFVEGFLHTNNRLKYFLKIYLISILMGAIQFGFYNVLSPAVRGDGFFPQNAMLSSFAVLFIVMEGMDLVRKKRFIPGIIAIVVPIIFPILMSMFVYAPLQGNNNGLFFANFINFTILPTHSTITDGGTLTLLEGMILLGFSYCRNKKIRIYVYSIFVLLWNVLGLLAIGMPLNLHTLFFDAFEWMEIISVPLMLCYNGKRGQGNSKLFYYFYPIHIYVLYGLSVILYMIMH